MSVGTSRDRLRGGGLRYATVTTNATDPDASDNNATIEVLINPI